MKNNELKSGVNRGAKKLIQVQKRGRQTSEEKTYAKICK